MSDDESVPTTQEEVVAEFESITVLPTVVEIPDQPCPQLYEARPVLLGYDVVHYHLIPSHKDGGVARRGKPEFAYNFNGYQFWFASQENRDTFRGDPWKYAPAFGGFCTWGVAVEVEPQWAWAQDFLGPPASPVEGWLIINDVLTFNIWETYSDRFMENPEHYLELATQRWKNWFGSIQAGPFNTHCFGHGPLQDWCLSGQLSDEHPWMYPLPESSCPKPPEEAGDVVIVDGNSGSTVDCFGAVKAGESLSQECQEAVDAIHKANQQKPASSDRSPRSEKVIRALSAIFVIVIMYLVIAFVCREQIHRWCQNPRCRKRRGKLLRNARSGVEEQQQEEGMDGRDGIINTRTITRQQRKKLRASVRKKKTRVYRPARAGDGLEDVSVEHEIEFESDDDVIDDDDDHDDDGMEEFRDEDDDDDVDEEDYKGMKEVIVV